MSVMDYLQSMDFITLRGLMLGMVSDDVDKTEGSFMYDAVTPIALFTSEIMNQMKTILEQSFLGTATGPNLDILAATMPRIYRRKAASERLTLLLSPPIASIKSYLVANKGSVVFSNAKGEAFSIYGDDEEWISQTTLGWEVHIIKNTTGHGTSTEGEAFQTAPAIDGLLESKVASIDARGSEEEDDDTFRVRIWTTMSSPFLGTVADYYRKIFAEFPQTESGYAVHNCFLMPRGSRSGYICVVPMKVAADGWTTQHCTAGELEGLQNYLDKRIDNIGGYGMGIAPIGHVVRVRDFRGFNMHFSIHVLVPKGRSGEIAGVAITEQARNLTNKYMREIIDEAVPSSTNYISDSKRYVTFFIHYYLNAHEYAVRGGLRDSYGKALIRNVTIKRLEGSTELEQNDLVVRSGGSCGMVPILGSLNVAIDEEE